MFDHTITDEGSCQCITVRGRIDALTAPDVQKVFDRLIMSGERVLLVDMAGVGYVSSAGLRVFLSGQKALRKVEGEIIFCGLGAAVLEVFETSGMTSLFRLTADRDEAVRIARKKPGASVLSREIEGMLIEWAGADREWGELSVIGSAAKTETASYGEEDVVSVKAAEVRWGCGLASIGDSYDEYKGLFGESMVINGSFFYYPAVPHSSADYLLNADKDHSTIYRFFHGFSFKGSYSHVVSFEGKNDPVDLSALSRALFSISEADCLGVTLIAESKGVWGMHLKKPPITEERPANGKTIFDSENFSDWIDFPVEPAYPHHVVVGTGIVVREGASLSPDVRSLVSDGKGLHIHGAVFEKAPLGRNINAFDHELKRIFSELQVLRVQHLLSRSAFKSGMVAVTELGDAVTELGEASPNSVMP